MCVMLCVSRMLSANIGKIPHAAKRLRNFVPCPRVGCGGVCRVRCSTHFFVRFHVGVRCVIRECKLYFMMFHAMFHSMFPGGVRHDVGRASLRASHVSAPSPLTQPPLLHVLFRKIPINAPNSAFLARARMSHQPQRRNAIKRTFSAMCGFPGVKPQMGCPLLGQTDSSHYNATTSVFLYKRWWRHYIGDERHQHDISFNPLIHN